MQCASVTSSICSSTFFEMQRQIQAATLRAEVGLGWCGSCTAQQTGTAQDHLKQTRPGRKRRYGERELTHRQCTATIGRVTARCMLDNGFLVTRRMRAEVDGKTDVWRRTWVLVLCRRRVEVAPKMGSGGLQLVEEGTDLFGAGMRPEPSMRNLSRSRTVPRRVRNTRVFEAMRSLGQQGCDMCLCRW